MDKDINGEKKDRSTKNAMTDQSGSDKVQADGKCNHKHPSGFQHRDDKAYFAANYKAGRIKSGKVTVSECCIDCGVNFKECF